MGETPQLTYCDEEVEDILLLCYANYYSRYKEKHPHALMEISNNALVDHYFSHLQLLESKVKKGKFKVLFRCHNERFLSAAFELQGPKKIFQNEYVNLKKWETLNNLTGVGRPKHSIKKLMAMRDRNLRVLTVASFFYYHNVIPSLNEIHEALEVYMKQM